MPNRPGMRAGLTVMAVRNTTKTTLRLLNLSRVMCKVRTGNLRNSHQMKVREEVARNQVVGYVFTHVKYARPVHDGRGARVIRPRRKKALAFTWNGRRWVLAKVTQGPVRGYPWLRRALIIVASQDGYKMTRSPRYNYPAGHL